MERDGGGWGCGRLGRGGGLVGFQLSFESKARLQGASLLLIR